MNEDYLWNRTGSDPEIERLEVALATFRHKASQPPELPAKVLTLADAKGRSWFGIAYRLAFASAAVAALSLIWLRFPVEQNHVGSGPAAHTGIPQFAAARPDTGPDRASADKPVLTVYKVPRRASRSVNAIAAKAEHHPRPMVLTAEEKFAYDQLMLALSITGSKLKIVKDKLSGSDDKDNVFVKEKVTYQK